MKQICIVTATRAEYGLLTPLIRRIQNDTDLELQLVVTGGHLSESQGMTVREIEDYGVPIACKIPILESGDSPYDVSLTMANAIRAFAAYFRDNRPDMLVILGDRTELLAIASAAMNERIPIAHICGGEVTEGAVDDCVRHALTKMSYLHFTETEAYRKRVIQLGESPERVFNVGSLGAENILHEPLLAENEIRSILAIPETNQYAMVTFQPVTLESDAALKDQVKALCDAMEQESSYFYVITKANADAGGGMINREMSRFAMNHQNATLHESLGMQRYLSAVKYAAFVLGNSSSGIIEAPVLGTPTVNIGDRQKGRLMADTIVSCSPERKAIVEAIRKAVAVSHTTTTLYGSGDTSEQIKEVIKRELNGDKTNLKKGFYDL